MKLLNHLLVIVSLLPSFTVFSQSPDTYTKINPEAITIVRDTFGMAHIFAKTDAEVAYGFAWSNAENDFKVMQESLIIGKAMSGAYEGKAGAGKDFINNALGIKEAVNNYYKELTPQFLTYLDAYCQGLNAYAEKHKDEILLKHIFPVTDKDVLRTYTLIGCFLTHIDGPVKKIVDGKYDEETSPVGSNAYAVNSIKSADGKTYLAINPHQPLEGPFSFHEAHLCSEEGLNVIGAFFPIGTSVFMGNNEHLGWGMTFNEYDLVDTYKLKMHPTKKLMYEFDGEWKELEKRKMKLKVKLWGPLKISVSKTTYWSVYGPTLVSKSKKDFYSLRTPANMNCGFAEEFYYMNKAKKFSDFYKALQLQGAPRFNVVYADKEGNIFYIDNGRVPMREGEYNWTGVLPGNTSKTLWTTIYKEEELPQIKNPSCGYVFNMNNTAFNCTCAENNLDATDYKKFPKVMGLKYTNSNRSIRFMEQLAQQNKLNFEDFKKMKYDVQFSANAPLIKSMNCVGDLNASKHSEIEEQINYIKTWDRVASMYSVGATYAALAVEYIFKKHGYGYDNFFDGAKMDTTDFVEALVSAKNHCTKYFGKTNVTLGELQRHIKGDKNLPLPGFSDVLAAAYTKPMKDGRYKAFVGESYTHFVSFSSNGPEQIETLLPFGNSNVPNNKHYTDQMELFSNQKLKTVKFTNKISDIVAEKIYHPK